MRGRIGVDIHHTGPKELCPGEKRWLSACVWQSRMVERRAGQLDEPRAGKWRRGGMMHAAKSAQLHGQIPF